MPEEKTNVMRILDQKKIAYRTHHYPHTEAPVDAETVATLIGQAAERVFKTLVAKGSTATYYVFVLPATAALDLKKAAQSVGEKSIELIPLKELTPLTGYVRGGCSPIGMKKRLHTSLDSHAQAYSEIIVSAGRIGSQVELSPFALCDLIGGEFYDLTKDIL